MVQTKAQKSASALKAAKTRKRNAKIKAETAEKAAALRKRRAAARKRAAAAEIPKKRSVRKTTKRIAPKRKAASKSKGRK